jgi:hypothetical protein
MTEDDPQPAAPPSASQPAPVETTPTPNSAQVDGEQPMQNGPTVLIPQKRSGLGGIVDEFRNAVAGKTANETYIDPNTGERYVQHPTLTGKQQWLKIGKEALEGAAAGLAHGQGPGGHARAAAAGIQAGMQGADKEQQQDEERAQGDYDRERQARMDRANDNINTAKLVAAQFANTRMQVKAGQEDIDWAASREKSLQDSGARLVGHANNLGDLARIQKEDEADLLKNHFSQNTYVTVPTYDEDGKANGIQIYAKAPGWGQQLADAGTTIPIYQPPMKPGDKPTRKDVTPTTPMTNDQVHGYQNLFDQQMANWMKQQAELAHVQAQTRSENAEAGEHGAQAAEAGARTENINAQTENLKSGKNADGTPKDNGTPTADPALAQSIASGHITPDRMGYLLARNPGLMDQVMQIDPKFDYSKAEAYPVVYKDFTSGKTAVALNAGATAMGHLRELQQLNTIESHVPGTAAWNAYQNKADTVATELAKFYGDSTVPAIASIKHTLTANLPGNREAAIRTQAQSMGDKFDSYQQQWDNAAPSAAYQAPMPGISQRAMEARAALDPAYAKRAVQQRRAQPAAQPPAAASPAATPNGSAQPGGFNWNAHPIAQ